MLHVYMKLLLNTLQFRPVKVLPLLYQSWGKKVEACGKPKFPPDLDKLQNSCARCILNLADPILEVIYRVNASRSRMHLAHAFFTLITTQYFSEPGSIPPDQ
jgi:hypothetical protein